MSDFLTGLVMALGYVGIVLAPAIALHSLAGRTERPIVRRRPRGR